MQNTHITIPKVFLGYSLDVSGGDGINSTLDLEGREPLASGDQLPSNILSDSSGTIKAQKQARLELALGTGNFVIDGSHGHACPLLECKVEEIIDVHQVLGHQVNTP